jgi:hypothetical protein
MLPKRNRCILLLVGLLSSWCLQQSFAEVWPGEQWSRATPESQGIASKRLDAAAEYAINTAEAAVASFATGI